jgi:hypothetical protein
MSHYANNPWPSPTFSDLGDFESKPLINGHDFDTSPVLVKKHNTGHAGPRDDHVDFSKGRRASDPRVLRHPHFWDTTGNVMLQMGSTLFRLHGSTLARHSPFFEDILRVKPRQDIQVDGALLHCLVLDKTTVEEVEVLLDAMENAVYVTEPCSLSHVTYTSFYVRTYHVETPSFEYIASLLRVSTTLDFPKFREYAIHCLDEAWPSDLANFAVGSKWHEHAAETVALARNFDVPSVLKRALYELVRTPGFSKVCQSNHHSRKTFNPPK